MLQILLPDFCENPHWKEQYYLESNRFISPFSNFYSETQYESCKCVLHQGGKVAKNVYSGSLKFNKTSLLHKEQRNVRCIFLHQVHCQLCRGAPRLRRLWLQWDCHQHYFGQTLAKAVLHSQSHAEQDVGRHARSAHKTNGNSVLGEWRRQRR